MIERQAPTGSHALRHRIRSPIAGWFLDRHALSAEDAAAFVPRSASEACAFDRLCRAGIVREPRVGLFYFDLAAHYARAERWRRLYVPIAIAVAVALAFIATRFYQG